MQKGSGWSDKQEKEREKKMGDERCLKKEDRRERPERIERKGQKYPPTRYGESNRLHVIAGRQYSLQRYACYRLLKE